MDVSTQRPLQSDTSPTIANQGHFERPSEPMREPDSCPKLGPASGHCMHLPELTHQASLAIVSQPKGFGSSFQVTGGPWNVQDKAGVTEGLVAGEFRGYGGEVADQIRTVCLVM